MSTIPALQPALFDVILAGTVSAHIPVAYDISPDLFAFTSSCIGTNSCRTPVSSERQSLGPALGIVASEQLFQGRRLPEIQPNFTTTASAGLASPVDQIVCIKFGHKRIPLRLFVASKSVLSVWRCDDQQPTDHSTHSPEFNSIFHQTNSVPLDTSTSSSLGNLQISQQLIKSDLHGQIHSMSVHLSDDLVAACVDDSVMIIAVSTGAAIAMQGHSARVTACDFFNSSANPNAKNWLLSLSEDRSFKVWDYVSLTCIYDSPIVSSSPLTSIAFDPIRPIFAIGSEDSTIRFYDPTSHVSEYSCEPRMIKLITMRSLVRKWQQGNPRSNAPILKPHVGINGIPVVSSLPIWRRPPEMAVAAEGETHASIQDGSVEHIMCILGLFYAPSKPTLKSQLTLPSRMCVGCPSLIAILNVNSYGILHVIDFNSPNLNMELYDASDNYNRLSSADLVTHEVGRSKRGPMSAKRDIQISQSVTFSTCAGLWGCVLVAIGHAMSGQITLLRIQDMAIPSSKPTFMDGTIPNASLNAENSSSLESLQDCVLASIRKNVVGEKWVENVYQDCIHELAALGVREIHQLPILFSQEPSFCKDVSFLPMYVCRDLKQHIKSVQPKEISFVRDALEVSNLLNRIRISTSDVKTTPLKKSNTSKAVLDLPVTFKSKIKSSGYTQAPSATKMFSGLTNLSQRSIKSKAEHLRNASSAMFNEYSSSGGPIIETKPFPIDTITHLSSITCIRYHPSGRFLATGSSDKCARFYRLPQLRTSEFKQASFSRDFHGHNSCVTDIAWRLNPVKEFGFVLLTTSLDGMVRLWGTEKSHPILSISCASSVGSYSPSPRANRTSLTTKTCSPGTISRFSSSAKESKSSTLLKQGRVHSPILGKSISVSDVGATPFSVWPIYSRFFHRDQFLVTTSGSEIHLRTYSLQHIDPSQFPLPNRQKPAQHTSVNHSAVSTTSTCHSGGSVGSSRTKVILRLKSNAQTVTALSCLNTLPSQYLVSATSNCALHLWDIETGQAVITWHDAHTRMVHWTCMGETLGGVATGFEKLFVSMSVGDGIKIWDIRCGSVRSTPAGSGGLLFGDAADLSPPSLLAALQLNGHVNKFADVRCSVSPCGQYIAAGSEDHHAYMYDIRMGRLVGKTRGNHGSVVTDVAFHPTQREMATGSQGGRIQFFQS
ncbi:hypothetical protein BASA50_005982 [Batrachochytrium salamandrivorans]|uniref:Anaphase-promoting complex subunit 4 WD40 domain-containing protein n=1 Tax=Batrachochytrium salamandrivorans TaxID=1357716 RepID=A0ABQ8FB18_9FUNG|nr:hypothetical protein BASA50_005982 [Batrachochytrium salamandrivorans]KAH9249953.1 hypothetical protein BASA81_012260 [Batrachochytrium salamandrivorans]KAH9266688.1 hypothetical protein BASA83_010363 [Batrachochytrium salamandrivorans]